MAALRYRVAEGLSSRQSVATRDLRHLAGNQIKVKTKN